MLTTVQKNAVAATLAKLKTTIPAELAELFGMTTKTPAIVPTLSNILGVNDPISGTTAKTMGVGWVRLTAQWDAIQPTATAWNWAATDAAINAANASGLKICLLLFGTPAWAAAAGQPAGNPVAVPVQTDWLAFVTAAVDRYCKAPYNVKFIQLWNEPIAGAFFNGTINEYISTMLEPAAPIVRAAGGLVVFGGWPDTQWLWAPNSDQQQRAAATTGLYGLLREQRSFYVAVDVLDLHYQNAWTFETVYGDLVYPGTIAKIWAEKPFLYLWQTEMGWESNQAGSTYEAFLAWAKAANLPNEDSTVWFWYQGVGNTSADLVEPDGTSLWLNGQQLVTLNG